MFQDIKEPYDNAYCKQNAKPEDSLLLFTEQGVLGRLEAGRVLLPTLAELPEACDLRYAFRIGDRRYYLCFSDWQAAPWSRLPEKVWKAAGPSPVAYACAIGRSLWRWYCANRFCGACGTAMQDSTTERARVCPACGNICYPKISPAVIAAVCDGDRLLLTKYAGRAFRQYALVAGFNEIGESIEQTVHREVLEETGLHVKNLRFYKSQPWVFTDSLLLGFFCELDGSDEIHIQPEELAEAGWFSRAALPTEHSGISLTGEMIECFRAGKNPWFR